MNKKKNIYYCQSNTPVFSGVRVARSLVFCIMFYRSLFDLLSTGTCFIQKIYAPTSSLLQGKYLPFSPSPLRLNIFRFFLILSLTQLYRYTPEIFLFSTAIFKYTYWAPLRRIGQEYSANVAWSTFQSLKRINRNYSANFASLEITSYVLDV